MILAARGTVLFCVSCYRFDGAGTTIEQRCSFFVFAAASRHALNTSADRNFKHPSGPRLPTTLLRVTSLMLRPS
jgi:hypothetical protein